MDLEKGDATALLAAGRHVSRSLRRQGPRRQDRHLGHHHPPDQLRPAQEVSGDREHLRRAAGLVRSQDVQRRSAQRRRWPSCGFIVVQIDGMGTSNRSKAFHDVALQEPGRRRLPGSHPLAQGGRREISVVRHQRASASTARRPAGRTRSAALLFHPEFYKVAVTAAGCHDNRMDKIWWNEQWMGWPLGPQYAASSNVDNAHLLQGKALIIIGEMDSNVDPASSLQVVNALVKANKHFDMLFTPARITGRRALAISITGTTTCTTC